LQAPAANCQAGLAAGLRQEFTAEDQGWTANLRIGLAHAPLSHPPSKASTYTRNTRKLFASGTSIHVDFHANRHFNDLGSFPGHCPLLRVKRDVFVLRIKLPRREKFANGIFLF
jgi:hypothetical protein